MLKKRSEQLIIYTLKDIHLAMGHSIETVILAEIRAEKMAAEVQKRSISSGKFVVWIGGGKEPVGFGLALLYIYYSV